MTQEFYIRFIKITLQTFIIIFKDHPSSITTLLIILSFDAFQSNWTGIIIDSFRFVKGLVLKFGLNFREFYFYSFFIGFFCFRLYFIWVSWITYFIIVYPVSGLITISLLFPSFDINFRVHGSIISYSLDSYS